MPLIISTPPPNSYDLISQAISRLSMAGGAAETVTNVVDPSQLNSALPHPVYTLGSSDIAQDRNLSHAHLIAWRFLIQNGPKTVAAIELSCSPGGSNLRFSSLDTGPFPQGTRDVVAQAEGLEAVKTGSYELRVLKAPSVYVMAVWLKNLNGPDDIIIPINPGQRGGVALASPATGSGPPLAQPPNDFLLGLKPSAEVALRFDSTPKSAAGAAPGPLGGQPPPSVVGGMPPRALQVSGKGAAMFNRQALVKSYANMIARTWTDETYLQLILADPAGTLAQAGMPTVPGAVIRVLQHKITGSGKIEDQVDAWIDGTRTGLYDLFLPMKPPDFDVSAGGAVSAEGGASCCCSPCCCCT